MLQQALAFFNTDKPQWYGWIDLSAGEVYSNLKLNDETAVMPTEEEVNAKIEELQWLENRKSGYPPLGEQFDKLWHDINNGTLDNTGAFYTALKTVKDDNPKPGE
jgi:hypothetical protein